MKVNPRKIARLAVGLAIVSSFVLLYVLVLGGAEVRYQDAKASGLGYLYWIAFTTGVFTSLTPCVYPMIPITLSVFGAKSNDVSKGKAFALSATYVLGMVALFAPLGMAFALAGSKTGSGQLLGKWYVVVPLCLVFLTFAVSLFGAFDIRLPQSWQNRLNRVGGRGFRGAFLMGLVGGLIAAPCVGPFAGSMLTAIGEAGANASGDDYLWVVLEGGTVMAAYALGIGLLFMFLALASMSAMPRSGAWMEWVKSFFGIALLVVIFYYLKAIIPQLMDLVSHSPVFRASTVGLILVGIGLGAIHLSFHGASKSAIVRKTLGIALVTIGGAGLWLSVLKAPNNIVWAESETAAYSLAKQEGKGVMIDFAAKWCAPCNELNVVINQPDIYPVIAESFVALKIDLTDVSDAEEALQSKYGAETLPAIIFLDANGRELIRIDKGMSASEVLRTLETAKARLRSERPQT